MAESTPALIPSSALVRFRDTVFGDPTSGERRETPEFLNIATIEEVRDGEVVSRQSLFLDSRAQGFSDSLSAKRAGVSLSVVDAWKKDEQFFRLYDYARREGTDYLRDLAFLRAHESDSVLMKLLEAADPETYKPGRGGGTGGVKVVIQNNLAGPEPATRVTIEGSTDDD